ncbi:MAG: hypothetical protein IJL41_05360 [Clostridia bacterium]|nr:hypothetical protein [Clostridia bacterium]
MIELPLKAFDLIGNGEHIALEIYEIYGFPKEIAYGGGFEVNGAVEISVGSYKVHANHCFTTGELCVFLSELQRCYNAVSGDAILKNAEQRLKLTIHFNKTGRVVAYGEFQENHNVDTKLIFEMVTDQTAILKIIRELQYVKKLFDTEK